jgi:hypothetical protein
LPKLPKLPESLKLVFIFGNQFWQFLKFWPASACRRNAATSYGEVSPERARIVTREGGHFWQLT